MLSGGEHNSGYRMALVYWDMAAPPMTDGAIDARMVPDANPELIARFFKIYPFVEDFRHESGMGFH